MLFEEGSVFKNFDNIFKYHQIKKYYKAYYNLNNTWFKEYDYEIITNNFGLVQNNDLKKDIPSILFLGDRLLKDKVHTHGLINLAGNLKIFN